MPEFTPTAEQQKAIDLFATGASLAVEAGAGTGKTSTLKLLGESTDRQGQYVAFNRAIVDEAKAKMPRNVAANTMHQLAWATTGKHFAHRLRAPRMKSREIANRLHLDPIRVTTQDGEEKYLGASRLAGIVMRTVTLFCQSADLEPGAQHVPYINGIDVPPGRTENNERVAAHIAPAVLAAWKDLQNPKGSLRFSHEHYLKMWQLSRPRIGAAFILFDEAQDASPVMRAVIEAQPHAQVVYVGDSQQSIYGFTGAVNALAEAKVENRTYLTQSWRFGPAIAAVANLILAELDADLRITGTDALASSVGPVDEPEVILTRTNAVAMTEMFRAVKAGRKPHIVGGGREIEDFAKGAKSLMEDGWTSHPELACFDTWSEVQHYVEQDEQGGDLRLMVSLIDEFGVDRIIEALKGMGREEDADLVISTAHKAKGREWDTVRLAGDFADEPDEDEYRLLYVACTRARVRLDITAVGCLEALGVNTGATQGGMLAEALETASITPEARAAVERLLDAPVAAEVEPVSVPLADATSEVIDRVLAGLAGTERIVVATPERIRREIVEALTAAGLVAEPLQAEVA